jgi:hypothetical protein
MPSLPAKPHLASLGTRFTIETLHNRELCINAHCGHLRPSASARGYAVERPPELDAATAAYIAEADSRTLRQAVRWRFLHARCLWALDAGLIRLRSENIILLQSVGAAHHHRGAGVATRSARRA